MAKDLKFVMLLDCYGELLTEHQRNTMELYYCEDLSLSEIAENENITRQGVHDAIKHAEQYLTGFEEKVGFVEKMNAFRTIMNNIRKCAESVEMCNSKFTNSKNISQSTKEIFDYIEQADALFR